VKLVITKEVNVEVEPTDVIEALQERGYTILDPEDGPLSQHHIDALYEWSDSLARCGFINLPLLVRDALYKITGRILP
jgi:hypothetical protein